MPSWQHITRRFMMVLLLVGIFAQLAILQDTYVGKIIARLVAIRGYNALERSAIIHEGLEFAGYMDFLRETIPPDAKVLLPPHRPPQTLENFGFVEYFLMPRELHNCGINEVEACVLRMTGDNSYIVVAGKFPPAEVALRVKIFIPYRDGLGVYAPPQ